MSVTFFENFQNDLELIYAKYSHPFDGDAEILLSACDLPENVKIIENFKFSNCGNWQVLPDYDCSLADSPEPMNSSYSSDENNGLLSYYKDEESGNVFTTPVHSVEEESDCSSCYQSDDSDGWDSDHSGPETPCKIAKNRRERSTVNECKMPLENFPSSVNIVSVNTKPRKDGVCSNFFHPTTSTNHSLHGRNALTDNCTKFAPCNGDNLDYTPMGQNHEKTEQTFGNITSSDFKSGLLKCKSSFTRNSPNNFICSDLLTAVHEFLDVISNLLPMSKNRNNYSTKLNAFEKCNQAKRFRSSQTAYIEEHEFFRDQEKDQRIPKKSVNVQPGYVFEKLFVRPKGSRGDGLIPVASRQSFCRKMEGDGSATEDNDMSHAHNCQLLQKAVPTATKAFKSPGLLIDEYRPVDLETPVLPVNNNLKCKPAHAEKSLILGGNKVLYPGSIHHSALFQSDQISSLDENEYKTSPKHGLDNRVISPGVKTPGINQSTTTIGSFPGSPTDGNKLNLSRNVSPRTPREDERTTSRGIDNSGVTPLSVPLKATPGWKCLRLHDFSPGLFHRISTLDKRNLNADGIKDVRNSPSSNPDKIVQQKNAPWSQRWSEPTQPADLVSKGTASSPERPLSAGTIGQLFERDSLSACQFKTNSFRRSYDKHDSLGCVTRRRLYPPGKQSTDSDQSLRFQNTLPFDADKNHLEKFEPKSKTPREKGLKGSNLDQLNIWSSPASSNDDSPKSKSMKLKNTPRRNSPGFHPYKNSATQRKSPSLSSPLQSITTASPSSSIKTVRWTSIGRNSEPRRSLTYANKSAEKMVFPSRKNVIFDDSEKTNDILDWSNDSDVIQDCCQGNCTKKFCFSCSMHRS